MTSVVFNEKKQTIRGRKPKQPFLVRLMMKAGFAETRRQALTALLVIAIMFFAAAGLISYLSLQPETGEQIYREDIPEDVRSQIPPEKLREIPSRN